MSRQLAKFYLFSLRNFILELFALQPLLISVSSASTETATLSFAIMHLRLNFRVFSVKVEQCFWNLLIIKFVNNFSGTLEETIDEEDKLESPNWKEYYKDKKFEISNNLSEMVA